MIRASKGTDENGQPYINLRFTGDESIKNLNVLVQRAMNAWWESAPTELRELSDLLVHGSVQPSNRDNPLEKHS